ncbi:MAG TPA: hypothetical protein VF756_05895 [Thermoanaerobaculia bacterium]
MTWQDIFVAIPRTGQNPDATPNEADTSATADVLLQVVLPIVLILAFFALQSARSFEHRIEEARQGAEASIEHEKKRKELEKQQAAIDAQRRLAEKLRKESEQKVKEVEDARQQLDAQEAKLNQQVRQFAAWWSEISQTEKGQLAEELTQALLEIQKQRLVAALERVESEYRQDLGLTFLLHKEIRLSGEGRLLADHQAFQKACQATVRAFKSEEARVGEKARLYRRVLQVAELADGGSGDVEAPVAEASNTRNALRARNGQITPANRNFLEERLSQLLAKLHREVLRRGRQVVGAALDHYRSSPLDELYRRNPEILKLKEEIVRASREDRDTTPYEESLVRRLYQQIKVDFDRQGYALLPEVWGNV